MDTTEWNLNGIPALLWGDAANGVLLAVHGNLSHKADVPIRMLAETAVKRGWQVLSFDLPQHGDRKKDPTPCNVQACVRDLQTVMRYAKVNWQAVGLFANSIGAYFSLAAYSQEELKQALFLSPVVDMKRVIENMMRAFQVTEARLEAERLIPTPIGETLDWSYYCYVQAHPVDVWPVPTEILYGERDDITDHACIRQFADRFCCRLAIMSGGEHYFHTSEQLRFYQEWLDNYLKPLC